MPVERLTLIPTGIAVPGVVTGPETDHIIAFPSGRPIDTASSGQLVFAIPAVDDIITGLAVDLVVALTGADQIVAIPCVDGVMAAQ